MKRGSAIAVVAVSAGILAAASVAGVAVVNASGRTPEPATVAVVADTAAVVDPAALPAGGLPTVDLPTIDLPTITPAPQPRSTGNADDDEAEYADGEGTTSDDAYEESDEDDAEYAEDDERAEYDDEDEADEDHESDQAGQQGARHSDDEGHDERDGDDD